MWLKLLLLLWLVLMEKCSGVVVLWVVLWWLLAGLLHRRRKEVLLRLGLQLWSTRRMSIAHDAVDSLLLPPRVVISQACGLSHHLAEGLEGALGRQDAHHRDPHALAQALAQASAAHAEHDGDLVGGRELQDLADLLVQGRAALDVRRDYHKPAIVNDGTR